MYVSLAGNDTDTCGSLKDPCRTIVQAVELIGRQKRHEGHICLNGTGTEEHPFDCKKNVAHDQNPGISAINKSVSIERFVSTPFIACENGFYFQRNVKINLFGITFISTPLTFDDSSHVQLINCSHQNTKVAVTIITQTIPILHFNIQGASFSQNTHNCVKILLKKSSFHSVVMNISHSKFQENGILGTGNHVSVSAVISIATDVKTPSKSKIVHISCYNVTGVKNRIPFLVLDLASATTKEIYNHVRILNNNLTKPSDGENKRLEDGMYISQASKTNVKFVDLVCANNSNKMALRCIKIFSDEAEVDIENSSFVGHEVTGDKGGAVSVACKQRSSLFVKNTAFEKNRANTGGGAVFLYTEKGILRLNFTNVNFSNCEATTGDGSAVMVGKTSKLKANPILYTLHAYFRNVRVNDCVGQNSSMCIVLKSGNVTFEEFHWKNVNTNIARAIYVASTGGKADVTLSESSFICSHPNASVFVRIASLADHKGIVKVFNTSLSNSQDGALIISPKYRVILSNVTISDCKTGLQISRRWVSDDSITLKPVNITIESCIFKHNTYDFSLTVRDSNWVSLTITNSLFTGSWNTQDLHGHAIRFFMPALKKNKTSRATITLDQVIFHSRPASSFALFFKGKKFVTIRRSIFRYCTSFRRELWNCGDSKSIYETATGGISILSVIDKPLKPGCVERNKYSNTHPLWRYDSHVVFEDNVFQENAGLIAGAVFVSNGNTTFRNCSFQDNFATRKTGQVYSAYGSGRVEFINCSFSSKRKDIVAIAGKKIRNVAFFYSESEGPLVFRNTSMFSTIAQRRTFSVLEITNGGYVDMDNNTSIHCKGSQLSLQNETHFIYTQRRQRYCLANITVLKFTCRLCSPDYYSLQTGNSYGFTIDDSFQCQPCPLGASCIRNNLNIGAKENFWGFTIPAKHPEILTFVPCPKKYCQSMSPQSTVSGYNRCHGNRTGFLCGRCAPGFTESLFSTDCQKATQRNLYLPWIVMIVFSFGLAVYFTTKPPLLHFVGRDYILWFLKRKNNEADTEQDRELLDSGYLKIAFYYYQVADLLMDNSLEEWVPKVPFIHTIVSAFNFEVRAVYKAIDFPLPGLTAVTKELLLSLVVLTTMANVVLFYCVGLVISLVRGKKARKPSMPYYMAVILEIVLLGYDRLAETSLGLMHCVRIGSEHRLFIDGNTSCWQTWQYLLLAYIIVFVVPLIAVLYFGSSKLYMSSISARQFLAACVLPLPFLVYWLLKCIIIRKRKDDNEEVCARSLNNDNTEVMKVLHEPFRAPIGQDKGTLYWESVLIGRRLILLTFHSFIPNAMLRFFFMAGACDFMAIHHIVKNPFRDVTANKVEAASLLTLSIIAKISLIKATLLSSGISAKGQNKLYIELMGWYELAAMGIVPVILCLLAVVAFLSLMVRLVVNLVKRIINRVRTNGRLHASLAELREPFLDNQRINS